MIQVEKLTKQYAGHPVLEGLSFRAEPGQITLLVGANGVGKTTSLRILSGLMRPDSGDAWIAGHSIVRERMRAQTGLSYLPQSIAFHPRLTCGGVLQFYADLRGTPRQKIVPLLKRTGLLRHVHKRAGELSGGLRQRLGLGVLLLADAPVLLLDEPGLSLDPEWRDRLVELLQAEAERGKTVLVTTHLLAEWEGVANRALHCHPGGAVSEIDPQHLRAEFATLNPRLADEALPAR